MQVKFIYEPVQPSDLFSNSHISVLPIFVTEKQFHAAQFQHDYLQELARAYIKRSNVDFIYLPPTLSVMLIAVRAKHKKRRILRKLQELYDCAVTADFDEFSAELPGLVAIDVLPYGGMSPPIYRFWKSKRGVVVSSGSEDTDKLFRSFLRLPQMARFTPQTLQHPGVVHAFEDALHRYAKEEGFGMEITAVNLYKHMAFVSVDVYALAVEAGTNE